MSLTTAFINFFAQIGWAYDLKTVSEDVIKMRVERTGDGTHRNHINNIWGWGDVDQQAIERELADVIYKRKNNS